MRLDHAVQHWLRANGAAKASLKEAQRRIRESEFTVGGIVATDPKQQFVPGTEEVATASGSPVELDHVFYLMNKPGGAICQRHPTEPSVYGLIPESYRRPDLGIVGRLDRDTTGTLLLTTDGGVSSLLLFPTSRVWKRYTADLDPEASDLDPEAATRFKAGLVLEDGTCCASASLEVLLPNRRVVVTLHEGFFHAVKRMLAHVGGVVAALHRDRFGSLDASSLAPGQMRPLTAEERGALVEMLPRDRVARRELDQERNTRQRVL